MKYPRLSQGEKFGRLTVIEECVKLPYHDWEYICRCDCGNELKVEKRKLLSGHTTSCGCRKHDAVMKFTFSEDGTVCDERISQICGGHVRSDNTSGFTGVRYGRRNYYGKQYYAWIAYITFKGKTRTKICKSKEEAIARRKEWEEELFSAILYHEP